MKQKDLLIIISSVFILTLLWVIFNIYHSHVSSTITDPLIYQIIPIEGKFDTATINKLKERKRINPFFETINEPEVTPTITIDESETETNSSTSAIDSFQTDITTEDTETP
jgi:hypothetical protein